MGLKNQLAFATCAGELLKTSLPIFARFLLWFLWQMEFDVSECHQKARLCMPKGNQRVTINVGHLLHVEVCTFCNRHFESTCFELAFVSSRKKVSKIRQREKKRKLRNGAVEKDSGKKFISHVIASSRKQRQQ